MAENDSDVLHRVQHYRKVVLLYEALNAEIDQLISRHGGTWEKMSEEDRARYRELARKRDEIQNEMRLLEQQLMSNDED